ncbi:MAG: TldD/PmbA family protein [Clostridia bacterium]|nr:MAG: TldD/PmbA family protein [Clostridia bacterium]
MLPDKELLQRVLREALARAGDFADVFVEERRVVGITCEADQIERMVAGTDVGAGIRVIAGGNSVYGYTNDLSWDGLMNAARIVVQATGEGGGEKVLDLRPVTAPYAFAVGLAPEKVEAVAKVELVRRANDRARTAGPAVRQVTVGYADTHQKVLIANTEGQYVEDERVRTRLMVNVVARKDGLIQTGYEAAGGFKGLELYQEVPPEQVADKAASRALQMLEARPAPSGRMPVVLSSEAGGTMVHEACGHGLEADLVQKKLSVYAGRIGEKVAAPPVTVIDDATLPGRYGSLVFDDEGTPGQKTVLIAAGVLAGYMYDRLTAGREGKSSTGNGRRESYQHRPIPRMRNTYIAPGADDPAALIASVRRGLLVKKMGGGEVNTANGDFVFEVAEGYMIENGRVAYPVRGATLAGNGPQVLQLVEGVGTDLGFGIGTCGKDGQGVPVGDAQPTILLRELVVGGTEQG